jgi:hypothetical protein
MATRFLPLLLALCALGGCFTPDYHCRIICGPDPGNACPAGFTCVGSGAQRLCAKDSVANFCSGPAPADAGAEAPSPPVPDAALDTTPTDLPSLGENPAELCYAGSCLALSPEMRQSLVLWLDPSTLPEKDMPVSLWRDRSREANDALPLPTQTPPRSRGDGLELSALNGGPLVIANDASLDFGSDNFTILVVARLAAAPPSCLLAKATFDRGVAQGVVLGWTYSTELGRTIYRPALNATALPAPTVGLGDLRPRLFVLQRTDTAAEARINGDTVATATIPQALSVSTPESVFLGGCGVTGVPIAVLHAAVVFRGSLPFSDLRRLEAFLMGGFPASAP